VGPDPAGQRVCDDRLPETVEDYRHFRDLHLDRIRKKTVVVRHFLAKGGWDYFEVVFCDLHCVGHHLWHVSDRSHPRYQRALEAELGDPLLDAYRELDKGIGEILSLVDERTLLLVYASHGIGPQYTGTGLLDRILYNLEHGVQASLSARLVKDRLRDAWRALPPGVKQRLRPIKNRLVGEPPQDPFLGGRRERKYFEVYANNSAGGVRINLKGREAHGIVEPSDYDALLDALACDLRDVINVESGEPLVEEIVKTHDHYSGPYVDRLPDLAVVWNKSHPIRIVRSPKIGMLRQDFAGPRTGDHTPSGAFYAVGAGVQAGALNHPVAPTDFAPTLRLRLGLDAGSSDGMPIRSLLAGHPTTVAV
jgi:predicted AlkP superfamily phosphohydrolase/phosphomutase